MSTDHPVLKNKSYTLSLDELSSQFDLDLEDHSDESRFTIAKRLSAEEVVDLAMKLIQPTLYNVEDPTAFMRDVVEKKLGELFV